MAFSDLSFKFFTDVGLTTQFVGLYQLTHKTDLSDNPQDLGPLYFGSLGSTGGDTEDRKLEASSNPGVDQIVLTPTVIISEWEASTAYTLGQTRIPTTPNTYRYEITTAGTSGINEPTWPTSIGSYVTDGTCIWQCVSKAHPATEIKLALSSGALGAATAGGALNLGTEITSGIANAIAIYIRVTNTVTTVESNTGMPELALNINGLFESAV